MPPSASGPRPQYPWTLSDGENTIGLMHAGDLPAIQRVPRTAGVERKQARQTSWHGGRGNEVFNRDTTRFYDSGALWSMVKEQLTPGPLMRWSRGYRNSVELWPGEWLDIGGSFVQKTNFSFTPVNATAWYSLAFTPSASFNADKLYLIVRAVGAPGAALTVAVYSNSGGSPNTLLVSHDIAVADLGDDGLLARVLVADWTGTQALVSGTTYHVVVKTSAAASNANTWEVGSLPYTTGAKVSVNSGSSWGTTAEQICFRLVDADAAAQGKAHFFEYKRALYCATEPPAGNAAQLYLNGDRGACTGTQAASTIVDSTKSWATDEWINCIALIGSGPMRGLSRRITANTDTALTVESAWPATPDGAGSDATEYVILGSDKWTLISSGLTAPVTSVIIVNGMVCLAQGQAAGIRRFREYNNSGTWTREFASETQMMDFLLVRLEDTGKVRVYGADALNVQVYGWDVPSWSASAVLPVIGGAAVGSSEAAITNLLEYNNQVWAPKEDSIWIVQPRPDQPAKLWAASAPVAIRPARDERNGAAAAAWNTFLYFSFLDGLERLFGQVVDDIGPNRDAGMPAARRGRVADLLPVLGYMYTAWDGGDERPSAILVTVNPGGTWHELYRSPSGQRLQSVFYQSVPGTYNRLWFAQGADLGYLVMPDDTHNPLNDEDMLYTWEAYLTTSWFDFDSPELDHFFDQMRLFSRSLNSDTDLELRVQADYQLNNDFPPTWTRLADYEFSPYEKQAVGDGTVTGQRIRLRLRIVNEYNLQDPVPVIYAYDLRANVMNEVLYDFLLPIRLGDKLTLLDGSDATGTAQDALDQLAAWQEDASPLTLGSMIAPFNGLRGHIDPVGLLPTSAAADEVALRGQIVFKQV